VALEALFELLPQAARAIEAAAKAARVRRRVGVERMDVLQWGTGLGATTAPAVGRIGKSFAGFRPYSGQW
jgi:hypothetical protein